MFNGLPPILKGTIELTTVHAMAKQNHIPSKLTIEAEIQRCIAKYHDPIIGNMDSSVRDSLVQLCDQELDNIPNQFPGLLDTFLTFTFLIAKLHLYTLALVKESRRLADKRGVDPCSPSTRFQYLGMTAAHRAIDLYCDDLATGPLFEAVKDRLVNFHRSLPKNYFRGVLFATFFLLKYFALNSSCPEERRTTARNKILRVHAKLREFAPHQLAEPGRAATVIEVLCRQGDPFTTEVGSEVEDRATASVAWDALISAANIRGRHNNVRTDLLDKINPTSPTSRSSQNRSAVPNYLHDLNSAMLESAEENCLLPEEIWDQSFLDMLDFSAYNFSDNLD